MIAARILFHLKENNDKWFTSGKLVDELRFSWATWTRLKPELLESGYMKMVKKNNNHTYYKADIKLIQESDPSVILEETRGMW